MKGTIDGQRRTTAPAEMVMKHVEYYKCQSKEHIAKYCPSGVKDDRKEVGMITLSNSKELENSKI